MRNVALEFVFTLQTGIRGIALELHVRILLFIIMQDSTLMSDSEDRRWNRLSKAIRPKIPEEGIAFSIRHVFARSWLNVMLIFVPFGIASHLAGVRNRTITFALNALAIIPLTGLLTFATENVSHRLGFGLGALLNITFGNLVELVIL